MNESILHKIKTKISSSEAYEIWTILQWENKEHLLRP